MEEVLKELGWDDGLRMPVANEENKALEMEIQKKLEEKNVLKTTVEDLTDRVASMKKHLGNVHQQLDINQNLIYAQNNQKTVEENLAKLARVEDSTLINEIKKLKKEQNEVQERMNKVQADVDRALQRVQRLNATIKWDKDALLTWDEEVSRGSDDNQMLEKFQREDEAKFKELELKRQILGAEVESKRNKLLSLRNDVLSMEQSLEKTARMFRRHHNDRMILVQQWEASVRVLHQRDEDINRVMEEIANLRLLGKERLKNLEEQKTFFENEQRNNFELEKEIDSLNAEISIVKDKTRTLETVLSEEQDQLATFEAILARTTLEQNKMRNQIKSNLNMINKVNELMVEVGEKSQKAEEDYEKCKCQTMSATERVHQLENILKEENKDLEKNNLALKKLDELLFQVTQQISELKEGEKVQESSIQHGKTSKATLHKHILKAKTEFSRQKEALYNMDYAYLEKDILFRKLVGESKDEDSEKYEKKISELELIHSKLTATHSLLTKEVQRLEDEMRRINVDRQFDAKEQEFLRNKRQEQILMIDGGQKQLDALKLKNQDSQVDENVLKLRVKQAENAIDKVGGKVFSLEKQRLELDEAMKEREIEIKALRDILTVRKRVLMEQTGTLNTRINLAKVKVGHMRAKYDVTLSKLEKNEVGEPITLMEVKVKSAQERFEIQEFGDKLDSKIKKTEKEIEAMENTLKVVNATNKAYKNNLQSVDPNCQEYKEKEELDNLHSELVTEYRKKKAIFDGLTVIMTDLEDEYQEKMAKEVEVMKSWKEKDQQILEAKKDLKDLDEKLHRAERQLKRLVKEIRGTTNLKFQTDEEKDVELRELMEQNEYGLQQLAELVAQTYDTSPVVTQYLAEKGMSLPMSRSPVPSLRCPSSASIPSSARSSITSRSHSSSKSLSSMTSKSVHGVLSPSVVSVNYPTCGDVSKTKFAQPCKAAKKTDEVDEKRTGNGK